MEVSDLQWSPHDCLDILTLFGTVIVAFILFLDCREQMR